MCVFMQSQMSPTELMVKFNFFEMLVTSSCSRALNAVICGATMTASYASTRLGQLRALGRISSTSEHVDRANLNVRGRCRNTNAGTTTHAHLGSRTAPLALPFQQGFPQGTNPRTGPVLTFAYADCCQHVGKTCPGYLRTTAHAQHTPHERASHNASVGGPCKPTNLREQASCRHVGITKVFAIGELLLVTPLRQLARTSASTLRLEARHVSQAVHTVHGGRGDLVRAGRGGLVLLQMARPVCLIVGPAFLRTSVGSVAVANEDLATSRVEGTTTTCRQFAQQPQCHPRMHNTTTHHVKTGTRTANGMVSDEPPPQNADAR